MKNTINRCCKAAKDFFEMIFFSAAENQILEFHKNKNEKKFRSFTQLKKHQKRTREIAGLIFGGIFLFFVGTVIGPALYPKAAKTEIYIPNGRGDILISNVSRNQVTLIFKTLDAGNDYKPLATKAYVEVCENESCSKIIRRTAEDDYAVTHVIPVDALKGEETYYFRITASDSSVLSGPKSVSSWGDGRDPIKVFTTGELTSLPVCVPAEKAYAYSSPSVDNSQNSVSSQPTLAPAGSWETVSTEKPDNSKLSIANVQNESYLQPKNKIQAIISWTTNIPASTVLLYSEGEKGEEKELVANEQNQTKHAAIVTTLKAGTMYYFKVKSVDAKGNVVISDEYSMHTPNPKQTVLQAIADNFKALMYQIKPE
jgi:hypothetical protein